MCQLITMDKLLLKSMCSMMINNVVLMWMQVENHHLLRAVRIVVMKHNEK